MYTKDCTKCIHKAVCKTAESCDGYVSGCEHFKEQKKGRWQRYTDEIFMGYDSRGRIKYRKRYTYECTCCGENKLSKTNYCPNCGADMRGE